MSEENIERLKAKRRGHRGVATKLIQEAKAIIESPEISNLNRSRLKIIDGLLDEKQKMLQGMDEDVLNSCKIDEIEKEIEDSDTIRSRILEIKGMIECLDISELSHSTNTPPATNTVLPQQQEIILEQDSQAEDRPTQGDEHQTNVSHEASMSLPYPTNFTMTPRLPKLILQKFNGDITKFRTFWDRFDSSVNKNPTISTIDKFNYLQGLLEGPASRVIQGLPLTEANYHTALKLLEERFGNTQQIISMHMDDLLQLPTCLGNKPADLRLIVDKVTVNVRGLEALGVKSEQYGSFLIPIIMSKLPADVRLQIARVTTKDVWQIEEVLSVLKSEVQAREMSNNMKTRDAAGTPRSKPPHSTGAFFAGDKIRCVYCDAEHFSSSCERVKEPRARKDILRKQGRCFLCLRKGHRISQCESNRRCRKCPGRHHQSICESVLNKTPLNSGQQPQSNGQPPKRMGQEPATGPVLNETPLDTTTTSVAKSQRRVLLQTARTYAYKGERSEVIPVRVLVDSGSQRSYITTDLQRRLGLKPIKTEVLNLNTFGDAGFSKKECDLVELTLQGRNGQDVHISALSFNSICSPLPGTINLENCPSFSSLDLADYNDETNDQEDIDVLIGSDYYWDVVTGNVVRESRGLAAVSSKFGWLVSGPVQNTQNADNRVTSNLMLQQPSYPIFRDEKPLDLTESLARFWNSESVGIVDYPKEQRKDFLRDVTFDETEGKYQVELPWKEMQPLQTSNFELCVSRLHHLNSRLCKDGLLNEYDDIIKEQERAGIIERVPIEEENNRDAYFLPHHGVVRTDKATTKLRVVFDGSAKDSDSEHSINDCLETGPNLTPHIFDVLIKFRSYPVAITADVEKAFHQVSVSNPDRDKLRFLWWENIEGKSPKMVQYRFRRLVFGLTSSPAILNGVIQHHLSLYSSSEPEVSKLLADSLYVDDFPGGAQNDDEAYSIYEKAKHVMSEGGFNLRKWHTNSKVVKERINDTENVAISVQQNLSRGTLDPKSLKNSSSKLESSTSTSPALEPGEEKSSEIKILGLNWNTKDDYFSFDVLQIIEYLKSLPSY